MGYQMSLLTQKQVDGKWVNVRVFPRDACDEDELTDIICRDDDIYQRHWDWLGMEEDHRHHVPRGLPDDLKGVDLQGEFVAEDGDMCISWALVDELLSVNWDRHMIFRDNLKLWQGSYGFPTIREFLGQPFIDWLQNLKSLGVERIVYYFS